MNQKELQVIYQKQIDSVNEDFFEDTKRCDVCSSIDLVFKWNKKKVCNNVERTCNKCAEYFVWAESTWVKPKI